MIDYICEIYHHNKKVGTLNGKLIETKKEVYIQIGNCYKIHKGDKIIMTEYTDFEYPEVIYVKSVKQLHFKPHKLKIHFITNETHEKHIREYICIIGKLLIKILELFHWFISSVN